MTVENIAGKVRNGERLAGDEARRLWEEAPLWLLGKLAVEIKQCKSGRLVYYNRNFHIEPSNVCLFACRFCSYRRSEGEEGAWDMSHEQAASVARRYVGSGVTEVHVVGSVHPRHDLGYWAEMVRTVRLILPEATIKAFSAVELAHMTGRAGLSYVEGLRLLGEAGVAAITGGGAEIFATEIRRQICPEKIDAEQWLALHEAAHSVGITSNATMLYGHIENIGHRIDHLLRLRSLQDRTGGFNAFIPLKYRSANNSMSTIGETGIVDDMRTVAMSRIVLDNFDHIKTYWPMYGKHAAEMALGFGADDIDGTIDNTTRIYSMAGATDDASMTVEEVHSIAAAAGLDAVERDTFYNVI
jgi:aminodeoxyfutalosine synthase